MRPAIAPSTLPALCALGAGPEGPGGVESMRRMPTLTYSAYVESDDVPAFITNLIDPDYETSKVGRGLFSTVQSTVEGSHPCTGLRLGPWTAAAPRLAWTARGRRGIASGQGYDSSGEYGLRTRR